MIWECTVCTNHFDGAGPPDYCSSCGSPREYFTAYHFYGLKTPSEPPAHAASPVQRPSYTESSITDLTCFRFHKKEYFHGEPQEFYRNFPEARHTFEKPHRFAGAGFNSGFYFATTAESAIAEKLFYSDIPPDETPSEPQAVLKQGDRDIWPRWVQTHGRYGLFRFLQRLECREVPECPRLVRDVGNREPSRHDVLSKLRENHPRAMEDSVEDHLRHQANLVVLSGSLLTRSVSRYAWTDVEGTRITAENPYYAVDAKTLEATRIAFREQNRLTAIEAADKGYLSDEELADEYTTDTWWVAMSERI